MELYENNLWIADIDLILDSYPEIKELAGKKVLITGATGLIGSSIVDILIRWNYKYGISKPIIIIAAGRNCEKICKRFSVCSNEKWFFPLMFDAELPNNIIPSSCDYIIHAASNASPHKITKEPVETMLSNILGLKNLLDFAREKKVNRLAFISSSEIYGKKDNNTPYLINEYGYIDILDPRSSYSIGKRAGETLCASYADEYGVDIVIIRPGHIYGPTASTSDKRVSSAWVYDVALEKDIIMKSEGKQIRSYCYCLDCASAILLALIKGKCMQAYNVSNSNSIITIKELAEILTEQAGVKLRMELPTKDDIKGFNPMINSSLDASYLEQIGWRGLFDSRTGLAHTVAIVKDILMKA